MTWLWGAWPRLHDTCASVSGSGDKTWVTSSELWSLKLIEGPIESLMPLGTACWLPGNRQRWVNHFIKSSLNYHWFIWVCHWFSPVWWLLGSINGRFHFDFLGPLMGWWTVLVQHGRRWHTLTLCGRAQYQVWHSTISGWSGLVPGLSLRIWAQFRKYFELHSFSLHQSQCIKPLFPNHPVKIPPFKKGTGKYFIVHFKYLLIDNSLALFEQLSRKCGLPTSHLFRYRLFSPLYAMLLDHRSATTDKLKMALEEDLGLPLSEDTRVSIVKLGNLTSLSVHHCLILFRVVHRAHISKSKQSSIYPDISPYCVKCKTEEASLLKTREN